MLIFPMYFLLQSILFPNKARDFLLYVASYERRTPVFFAYSGNDTRKLYLTEEAAKNKTRNAATVKQWLCVKVSVDAVLFDDLYTTQILSHKKQIQQTEILPAPELKTTPLLKV